MSFPNRITPIVFAVAYLSVRFLFVIHTSLWVGGDEEMDLLLRFARARLRGLIFRLDSGRGERKNLSMWLAPEHGGLLFVRTPRVCERE